MKSLTLLSIAALCSVSVATAQQTFNIARQYKHSIAVNGGSHARQGVFANGKFYIHVWQKQAVEVWSQEGQLLETFESKGTGPGITADQAGNIMIENTDNPWPEACGQTRDYRIFKHGENDPLDLTITFDGLRETESGVRSDYFGPIEGDIMSDEGGTFVCMVQHRPVLNVARIAKGALADNFSIWVDTAFVGGNIVCNMGYGEAALRTNWNAHVASGASYSQVSCYKRGDEYLLSKVNVGLKGFKYDPESLGSHPVETNAYKGILTNDYTTVYDQQYTNGEPVDSPNMSGDRLFDLGGRLYAIKHVTFLNGSVCMNSFAIADDKTDRIVGLWYGYGNGDTERAGTASASWFTVIPVDDTTAEIYQYFPADGNGRAFISKYVFTTPLDPIND